MVLNLWFTTCAPCIAEIPDLNKMKEENPGVVFVAMTFEEKEKVKKFLEKMPFGFHQVTDAKGYVDLLESGYPTTLFIDKTGMVRDFLVGASLDGSNAKRFTKSLRKIQL